MPLRARTEHDFLGERSVPAGAYWGVHTARALENFPVSGIPVSAHRDLVAAGVTDYIGIPWVFEGLAFDAPVDKKIDSMKRFAETYIHSGWQQ